MRFCEATIKRTAKGVDEHYPNVVAQGNVTMMNKGKATFRLPTVRPGGSEFRRLADILARGRADWNVD